MKVKVTKLCPALCDPMVYTVHGILQAIILDWVAFLFSRGSFQPGNNLELLELKRVSLVALVVKITPANAGDVRDAGLIPGPGSSPGQRAWQPTPVFLPGETHA